MPNSPNQLKMSHKSSGKLFRNIKDKSGNPNGGNLSNVNAGNSQMLLKKDDTIDLKECPLTLPDMQVLDSSQSLQRYNSCKYLYIIICILIDPKSILILKLLHNKYNYVRTINISIF